MLYVQYCTECGGKTESNSKINLCCTCGHKFNQSFANITTKPIQSTTQPRKPIKKYRDDDDEDHETHESNFDAENYENKRIEDLFEVEASRVRKQTFEEIIHQKPTGMRRNRPKKTEKLNKKEFDAQLLKEAGTSRVNSPRRK